MMRRTRQALGLAAASGLLLGFWAAPVPAETLRDALAFAYTTNPQLLAQRALLRATDEGVPQALANWRPTVTFTGEAGYEADVFQPSGAPSHSVHLHPESAGLALNQPIYRGGRSEAQLRAALDTVEAARAQTFATETSVFQLVVTAYLDVVRDQNLVEVDRGNEKVLREQLRATRERFRVGEVTATDVAQAESALAQATATRIAAQGALQSDRAAFTHAVGRPPGRLLMPRVRPALPATREDALRLAALDNPNVIAARFTEFAARQQVALVRGQLLPQISIVGTLQRAFDQSSLLKNVWQNNLSVLAQMTMPLYEGGAIYSQTRQAEQTVGQKRSLLDDARRAAVQSATQSWETLVAARASITSFEAAVRAAQIALAGTEQEALVGTRTVLDVLIAAQQLLTTRSQLVGAEHDAALAEFNLTAAVGRLIAPDLKLPVKLYDLDRHYNEVKNKWFGFRGGLKE
jgi:outer membrane protein